MDLAELVASRQQSLGMTSAQLQRELGLSRNHLRELKDPDKTWRRFPELNTMAKLSLVLGVPRGTVGYGSLVSTKIIVDGVVLNGQYPSSPEDGDLSVIVPTAEWDPLDVQRLREEIDAVIVTAEARRQAKERRRAVRAS